MLSRLQGDGLLYLLESFRVNRLANYLEVISKGFPSSRRPGFSAHWVMSLPAGPLLGSGRQFIDSGAYG